RGGAFHDCDSLSVNACTASVPSAHHRAISTTPLGTRIDVNIPVRQRIPRCARRVKLSPNRSGRSGCASKPVGGMRMVPEPHQYGVTWAFYVVAAVVLCGLVASLWLIVKGAIGVFGQTPRSERRSALHAVKKMNPGPNSTHLSKPQSFRY